MDSYGECVRVVWRKTMFADDVVDRFAWTNYPSINFMASIAAGVPFGFGMVLVFLGVMNYLIE